MGNEQSASAGGEGAYREGLRHGALHLDGSFVHGTSAATVPEKKDEAEICLSYSDSSEDMESNSDGEDGDGDGDGCGDGDGDGDGDGAPSGSGEGQGREVYGRLYPQPFPAPVSPLRTYGPSHPRGRRGAHVAGANGGGGLFSRDIDLSAHSFFMSGLALQGEGDRDIDGEGSYPSEKGGRLTRSPGSVVNFSTYFGESIDGEDLYVGGGDGDGSGYMHGFGYDHDDEGESSEALELDGDKNNDDRDGYGALSLGWQFGLRQHPNRRNTRSSPIRTIRRSLSLSACTVGEADDEDDRTGALPPPTELDDASKTLPGGEYCFFPFLFLRMSQANSTVDLDAAENLPQHYPLFPSLMSRLLGAQRLYGGSSPALLVSDDNIEEFFRADGDEPTNSSDLRGPSRGGSSVRSYHVVTTAALPWMTGTAVNPLLRAAYLNRAARRDALHAKAVAAMSAAILENDGPMGGDFGRSATGGVTLVVPWLRNVEDRKRLYGEKTYFLTRLDQEIYIRTWIKDTAGMGEEAAPQEDGGIGIIFYDAGYQPSFGSIFPTCDICSLIPDQDADVAILEEPEHLNWFTPCAWQEKFTHVVGIIHTNYKAYASAQFHGIISNHLLHLLGSFVVRAHCHKVISLSGIIPSTAPHKEIVCNVHGIRSDFLPSGGLTPGAAASVIEELALAREHDEGSSCRAYFIGKVLWEKGFDKLLDLQAKYHKVTGSYFPIDIYGSGPDEEEIKRSFYGRSKSEVTTDVCADENSCGELSATSSKASIWKKPKINTIIQDLPNSIPKSRYELRRTPIPARFLGRQDHAELKGRYKVFVNCSISEVLCTTTAESVAMGNFVIIPDHPSNTFFQRFPNVLMYRTKSEFVDHLDFALENDPPELTAALTRELTWEAATERLVEAAAITKRDARRNERTGYTSSDERSARFHASFGTKKEGVAFRKMFLGDLLGDYSASAEEAVEPEPDFSTGLHCPVPDLPTSR